MSDAVRIAILALAVALGVCLACGGHGGDDDGIPAADDDLADDDAGGDDAGDDDTGSGRPHPYTPCCDVAPGDVPIADPALPADGAGPYLAVRSDRTFVDAARGREIPAYVYFPSRDGLTPTDDGAPFPVVTVAHGFSESRGMMAMYGERLATWGYVAIVPQLPYTSVLQVMKMSHTQSAKDLLFLLNTACCEDEDVSSLFYGRVDRARLGAVGHSLGGKLSTLAAYLDGGVLAAAGLDPVDGAGPIDVGPDNPDFPTMVPDRVAALTIPTLYLGSELGGTPFLGQACAPTDQNYHQFWLYSPSPSVEIMLVGADHTDFVSPIPLDPCDIGTADPARVVALAEEYVTAFLNDRLRGWERFRDDYAGAGVDADQAAGAVVWERK